MVAIISAIDDRFVIYLEAAGDNTQRGMACQSSWRRKSLL
jgi:hypothetical protein